MQENLFSIKEADDLYHACSSSQQNKQICSDSSFWEEKFRRENLPLLEEGTNLSQWIQIYQRSLQAARRAEDKINSGERIRFSLLNVSEPGALSSLPNGEELVSYWKRLIKQDLQPDIRGGSITTESYFLIFSPQPSRREYEYKLFFSVATRRIGGYAINQGPAWKGETVHGNISTEDLWFLLYQLLYSGDSIQ
ncbi:F-box domain-containing protein [Cedratvirus Zaza IHUMI]|uniref:F-box domain-containing protein n=1 Tax=Cedratvirus Zaza IHUMI TaxID=2126979 RepID=A0A2R8FEE2_9VIRU|nr:F-box domain-containing protein [Cedratvirus Zaza IHUMI]